MRTQHQLADPVRDLLHRRLAVHQVEHGLLLLLDRVAAFAGSRTVWLSPDPSDVAFGDVHCGQRST
jgi:hypothetical protein